MRYYVISSSGTIENLIEVESADDFPDEQLLPYIGDGYNGYYQHIGNAYNINSSVNITQLKYVKEMIPYAENKIKEALDKLVKEDPNIVYRFIKLIITGSKLDEWSTNGTSIAYLLFMAGFITQDEMQWIYSTTA